MGQQVDLGLVDIHPEDLVAELGHAGRVGGSQVAGPEDGEPDGHGDPPWAFDGERRTADRQPRLAAPAIIGQAVEFCAVGTGWAFVAQTLGGHVTGSDPDVVAVPTVASPSTLSRIMTAVDVNLLGTVHGGVVMKLVDDVAGVAAARHSRGSAVTVAMDEMVFLRPVHIGDLVHVHAQVNWAGRSSMEVGVRVTAERWDEVVPPQHVATAYLVFVAIDAGGEPRQVPPVLADDATKRRRFAEAEIRRSHRLARRAEIQASRSSVDADVWPPLS
jgi:acyl-CoA hydrolase